MSKNQIKFLPEDFGLLRNLRHLDLYNNQLEHLPLSFGDLTNLRYLDLKGNPLTPALAKIVGICTTTKDCQDSAKRTVIFNFFFYKIKLSLEFPFLYILQVKFMSSMQIEAIKAKEQYKQEILQNQIARNNEEMENLEKSLELQQQKSKKTKKSKPNKKKSNQEIANNPLTSTDDNITITKANKVKKSANGSVKSSSKFQRPSTALTSLLIFLLMVAFNVVIIYMIMFKNPEIAEKIVESIPHQYRDWILTKTEIFRLRVTDWISEFRTPPEEH